MGEITETNLKNFRLWQIQIWPSQLLTVLPAAKPPNHKVSLNKFFTHMKASVISDDH